jgi:hypothetical protein
MLRRGTVSTLRAFAATAVLALRNANFDDSGNTLFGIRDQLRASTSGVPCAASTLGGGRLVDRAVTLARSARLCC